MTEGAGIGIDGEPPRLSPRRDAVTRGFLFADLRGYTDFVERHGAAAAASLLTRYRSLVRDAIQSSDGAEIKTEGDSFYIVYGSVSAAVRCALTIVNNAANESASTSDEPIRVGVGVHAGETVETEEGYVGSAVNIAARICAQAGPGEALVSETVRDLTRTVLPVRYESRGRRKLKGIAEPIAVFAAFEAGPGATAWPAFARPRSRTRMLALFGVGVLAVLVIGAAGWSRLHSATGLPPGALKIAVAVDLSGDPAIRGQSTIDGAKLGVDDINAAGGIAGHPISLDVVDHGDDPEGAAAVARQIVEDQPVVALIGPWISGFAIHMIPVTNEAGLLQCSPANTLPELTKPSDGALDVRKPHPDRINYVRLIAADDIEAPGLAAFAYREMSVRVVLLIDDGAIGQVIADPFAKAFSALGGSTLRQTMPDGSDPRSVLGQLNGRNPAQAVFFAGTSAAQAAAIRHAMVDTGHKDIPLLSWGAIAPSPVQPQDTYLDLAGPAGANTYIGSAAVPPMKASFADHYRATFGPEPDEYAAAAYACVELIAEGLRAAAKAGVAAGGLRESVRAYVVDPKHRYETVIGTVWFDANGDTYQQYVTFSRVDPTAANGTGGWVVFKQQDYGPAAP